MFTSSDVYCYNWFGVPMHSCLRLHAQTSQKRVGEDTVTSRIWSWPSRSEYLLVVSGSMPGFAHIARASQSDARGFWIDRSRASFHDLSLRSRSRHLWYASGHLSLGALDSGEPTYLISTRPMEGTPSPVYTITAMMVRYRHVH